MACGGLSGARLANGLGMVADTPGVGADDYARWKSNYGRAAGDSSGVSANGAVPESATLGGVILAAAGCYAIRRRV